MCVVYTECMNLHKYVLVILLSYTDIKEFAFYGHTEFFFFVNYVLNWDTKPVDNKINSITMTTNKMANTNNSILNPSNLIEKH